MNTGTVIKSTGSWYSVRVAHGQIVNCRIKGKFRLDGQPLTNPIAVGDVVEFDLEKNQDTAIITKIAPRENYIVRQSPRKKHYLHLLAANVDLALLVTTIKEPQLKPGFIDRFLLTTAPQEIPTTIVINKADIYDEEDRMVFGALKIIYEKIGYPVFLVSSITGEGIEDLTAHLANKTTFISGHSGVGKSTLANAIDSSLDLKTTEISDYSGKGQHTTTFAQMFELPNGGSIIDTPGIKELAFINMEPMDIAHNFKEFFEASENCKFHDCMHINEPKCAVKKAIEAGDISEMRYFNYLKLIDETNDQNYWERKTDW